MLCDAYGEQLGDNDFLAVSLVISYISVILTLACLIIYFLDNDATRVTTTTATTDTRNLGKKIGINLLPY